MNPQLQVLRARFNALAAREKLMVAGALVVIVGTLLWLLAIGPALATLRTADQQRRALDEQMQRMAALKTQAQARSAAHTLPSDAHLTRNASGQWEGNVVLVLPRT